MEYTRINTSKQELSILLKEENPVAICLQETMCKDERQSKINGYQTVHKKRNAGARAAGGVLIGINNEFTFQEIDITTTDNIEAIAAYIEPPVNLNLVNIYIPPDKKIDKKDLQEVIDQVNKPLIIMGDFNAHNQLWGATKTTTRGKIIEEILNDNNLNVMNDDEITYISN